MKTNELPPAVQFYDNLDEISSMVSRRFPLRRIWETLQSEDRYTGDYTHFCRLVKKEQLVKKHRPPPRPQAKASALNHSQNPPAKSEDEQNLQALEDDGPELYLGDLTKPTKK